MFILPFFSLFSMSLAVDGPWNILGYTGYAGEIVVNSQSGSSIFYWQFNSLKSNINTDRRPLIIWSQGGPGNSSLIGMFAEGISPITINSKSQPQSNPATWALNFHLLAIDSPYNTGFSISTDPADEATTSAGVAAYLYSFLQLLAQAHPAWFARDIYWFGEDYAGHFIPAIASLILTNNANAGQTGNVVINLKGIGLGNPWADAYYQSQYYSTAGYNLGLLNYQQSIAIASSQTLIRNNLTSATYNLAFTSLQSLLGQLNSYTNNVNLFNTRYYSQLSFGNLYAWLNLPATKKIVNVPVTATWYPSNPSLQQDFGNDLMQSNATGLMPNLLNNLKVLIYQGQDDLYVNNLGVNYWISAFKWSETNKFLKSRRGVWNAAGSMAGYAQTYSNLTFVQILAAGNQAQFDQPYAVRDMINRFVFNQGWN